MPDSFGSATRRQSFIAWYGPDQAVHVATLLFDETRLIIATLAGRQPRSANHARCPPPHRRPARRR